MDDAAFKRDRLIEAAKRLGVRVDELKALEQARAQRAEHKRVLAERAGLAAELEHMVEPLWQMGRILTEIEACDRWARQINAYSAQALGYVRPVLADAPPTVEGRRRRGRVHGSRASSTVSDDERDDWFCPLMAGNSRLETTL
jgi:hypothetical protein